MTGANIEDTLLSLEQILYIYYLLYFQKDTIDIRILSNFGNKVNTITPAYASKLDLKTCFINVGAQKIDGSALQIFEIALVSFKVENKLGRPYFF